MKWIKRAEDVTCALLWKEWSTNFPEDRLVLLAKERIKNYTRSDWDMMVEEAHALNAYLAKLIVDKVPVTDPKAEHGFELFAEHYIKWFFPIDEEYIHKLALETSINKKYALFFEKQAPGLGMYLPRLIIHYAYKLRPVNA